ncbi:MAG: hypothetical protein HYZ87_02545 [Candidatus Omnitrophica bacterium]|nr:hypothetical protein [Candidatus Omnitrophota bacterium]
MKAVVLSNQSQFSEWVSRGYRADEFSLFCDNPRLFDFLRKKGLPFQELSELSLKDQWAGINAWGCAEVSRWMKACQKAHVFSDVDLASVVRHFFAMTLIPAVKNHRFAREILASPGLTEVVTFESSNKRKFPFFSGNGYLNHFLAEGGREAQVSVSVIPVYERENLEYVVPVTLAWALVSNVKKFLKQFFNVVYRWAMRPDEKISVVAHGSLRHLGSTIGELKKRGEAIALFDFEFHFEQFRFALEHKIPYWLPPLFDSSPGDAEALSQRYFAEFKKALELMKPSGLFIREGHDFSGFITSQLFYGLKDYCEDLAKRARLYEDLLKACRLRALVLDEDYALRCSFLAAFMKARGLALFCVSHANLGIDFSIQEPDRNFHHAWTCVHSEFERDMYAVRGWDPSKIVVTGTPRYDRLLRLAQEKRPKKNGGALKLLYTATGLWGFSPDQHGYLGCHFVCYGDFQIPAFKTILEAIEGLPIEMTVKPHSAESVPMWHQFIRELQPKNSVRITAQADDYFKLLTESDAMILSYWSTGLIESALCGVPTFFVRPSSFESPVLKRFSEQGYCHLVSNTAELRQAMRALCQKGPGFFKNDYRKDTAYYLSFLDAQSTGRVADLVQNGRTSGGLKQHE